MLSQVLKEEVESYYRIVKDSSPLYVNARLGKLSEEQIKNYLANIHFLLTETQVHLSLAKEVATKRGSNELAEFFAKRIHEESGHEKWAERDLEKVSKHSSSRAKYPISHNLRVLTHYLQSRISEDPRFYLGYILLVEYFTVLMGPQWLEDLETHCGVPKSALSVVGNHAELDKDHVQDDLDEIDALCGRDDAKPYVELMRRAGDLLNQFSIEAGTVKK